MEMIGSAFYIEQFKNSDLNELIIEKQRLEQVIKRLERLCRHPEDNCFPNFDLDHNVKLEFLSNKNNEVKLSCNKAYLIEMNKLIDEKKGGTNV